MASVAATHSLSANQPLLGAAGQRTSRQRDWSNWALLIALSIFASRTAWYDLRIAFEDLRGFSGFRPLLMLYSAFLVPFIGLSFAKGFGYLTQSRLTQMFLLMNLYGLVICSIHGNLDSLFTFQDFFKLTFVPAGFALACIAPPNRVGWLLRKLAGIVLIFQIIKLAVFLRYYTGSFGLYYGGIMDVYPFCFYMGKYFSGDTRNPNHALSLAALSLLILLLGQKRTVLVCCAAVLLYLFFRFLTTLAQRPSTYLVTGLGLVICLLFSGTFSNLAHERLRRVTQTDIHTSIGDESARLRELRIIADDVAYHGPHAIAFGFGHGAVFEDDVPDPTTGETLTHSVHFTPGAMYLRYGFVGIAFFAIMTFAVLFSRETTFEPWLRFSDVAIMKAYGVVAIISSLSMYGLMDDVVVGAFLGTMYLSNRTVQARRFGISRKLDRRRQLRRAA
jgi:hypothetical protein